jgi:hypothetical protein
MVRWRPSRRLWHLTDMQWNCVASLSHLTFADVSSAFAQASSTGGTIGRQDKSSGWTRDAARTDRAAHINRNNPRSGLERGDAIVAIPMAQNIRKAGVANTMGQ